VVASRPSGETDPVGYLDPDGFLNGAVAIDTVLEPGPTPQLLDVERELGRVPRWGPR